jgi:ComF family protein
MTPLLHRLRHKLRPWSQAAVDLLLPPSCASCFAVNVPMAAKDTVCHTCHAAMSPVHRPFCMICGEPFMGQLQEEFSCSNCQGRKSHYDFAVAAYHLSGFVRELIHALKFEGRLQTRAALGWLASHALADDRIAARTDWVLVPVPLHRLRQREREFNQSEEIAREMMRFCTFPMLHELRRIRDTGHQARLSRSERLANLKGAFDLSRSAKKHGLFQNKAVLLVDDVFTTGATAQECAKVLKNVGGASVVAVVTVARG